MTLEEAINVLRCKTDGNAAEALEVVLEAAEKSNKYRKRAKRFKRKWLGLRINVNEFVQAINHEYFGRELENKKLFDLMQIHLVNTLSDKL